MKNKLLCFSGVFINDVLHQEKKEKRQQAGMAPALQAELVFCCALCFLLTGSKRTCFFQFLVVKGQETVLTKASD